MFHSSERNVEMRLFSLHTHTKLTLSNTLNTPEDEYFFVESTTVGVGMHRLYVMYLHFIFGSHAPLI